MAKDKLNVVVFGGSNSASEPGYIDTVTEVLNGIFDLTLTNASVGGNTSVFALMQVKMGTEVEGNDAVIIEFAVNDYMLCRPEIWPFYCATVEGLVREILNRNPRAQIFFIMLGRRSQETAAQSRQMLEFSQKLGDQYGTHTVPVDTHLQQTLSEAEFRGAYSDDLHYRRGFASAVVGPYVAQTIATALHAAPLPRLALPTLTAETFEGAVVVPAGDILPRPVIVFENSRYVERAVEILAGETVKVVIPGRLLLTRFVSCANSCRVRITESGGKTMVFDTARPDRESRFAFLIRSTPFSRRDWGTVPKGVPNELTIEVLPPEGPGAGADLVVAPPTTRSGAPAFYLSSLLVL